jgi:hypothetical protein
VKQHFLVKVSKQTILSTGGVLQHVFEPAEERVAVTHFRSTQLEFVDESAVSVSGVVKYDFDALDFAGNGPCTFVHVGACYCPVRSTKILVDKGRGDVETHETDPETGVFAFSVTHDLQVTVSLAAFSGLGEIGQKHAFRLDVRSGDGESSQSSTSPSTTFIARGTTVLEFVATDSIALRVGVLGGGDGEAYVNGQPVVFGLGGCGGFHRKLYT